MHIVLLLLWAAVVKFSSHTTILSQIVFEFKVWHTVCILLCDAYSYYCVDKVKQIANSKQTKIEKKGQLHATKNFVTADIWWHLPGTLLLLYLLFRFHFSFLHISFALQVMIIISLLFGVYNFSFIINTRLANIFE